MRVRMLSQECGPRGNFSPGEEREVSDEHGRTLIAARAAVNISPPERAVIPPVESTAAAPHEVATVSPSETRKGGKRK